MLKRKLAELHRSLDNATDQDKIDNLKDRIDHLKRVIFDVEMIEFEERVGFKSMEQNAGVWDER